MKPTRPTSKPKKPSVKMPASARAQAVALLALVLRDRLTVDEAIAKVPLTGAEVDQRFAMLLLMTTLQHLGQIDALLAGCLDKKLPAKRLAVTNALRIGVVQLLLLHTPAHAAVHETVTLVKHGADAGLAGLVNAVLQKIAREKPALPAPTENLPQWVRARWEAAYGAQAVAAMAAVASTRAPLDVHSAQDMGDGVRLDAQMLRFAPEHASVEHLPGYAEGAFFVQDVAASYPVRLLGDVHQHQVLDICAAPGGKSMQLIRAGAFVTAIDRSASRMKAFKANMARMQMQANIIVADACVWEPRRLYDAVLLDAPCSATGTWRRHPEVVQQVRAQDVAEMVALQRALLARVWAWLKPGGKLVYCVCSLEPEEGEAQAAWFLAQTPGARVVDPRGVASAAEIPSDCFTAEGYLRTLPSMMAERGGMDGFFAVCLEKQ